MPQAAAQSIAHRREPVCGAAQPPARRSCPSSPCRTHSMGAASVGMAHATHYPERVGYALLARSGTRNSRCTPPDVVVAKRVECGPAHLLPYSGTLDSQPPHLAA
jgi:hypothetical protein